MNQRVWGGEGRERGCETAAELECDCDCKIGSIKDFHCSRSVQQISAEDHISEENHRFWLIVLRRLFDVVARAFQLHQSRNVGATCLFTDISFPSFWALHCVEVFSAWSFVRQIIAGIVSQASVQIPSPSS